MEQGALLRAAFSYRRRRPLLALVLLMVTVATAGAQENPYGLRMGPVLDSTPAGPRYFLLVEYRGPKAIQIAAGSTLLIGARRQIVHLTAIMAARPDTLCEANTCRVYEKALFPVGADGLHAIAASSTTEVILVGSSGTALGRLEFDHLARVRWFVLRHLPRTGPAPSQPEQPEIAT